MSNSVSIDSRCKKGTWMTYVSGILVWQGQSVVSFFLLTEEEEEGRNSKDDISSHWILAINQQKLGEILPSKAYEEEISNTTAVSGEFSFFFPKTNKKNRLIFKTRTHTKADLVQFLPWFANQSGDRMFETLIEARCCLIPFDWQPLDFSSCLLYSWKKWKNASKRNFLRKKNPQSPLTWAPKEGRQQILSQQQTTLANEETESIRCSQYWIRAATFFLPFESFILLTICLTIFFSLLFSSFLFYPHSVPHVHGQRDHAYAALRRRNTQRHVRGRQVEQTLFRLRRRQHLDDDLHGALLRLR